MKPNRVRVPAAVVKLAQTGERRDQYTVLAVLRPEPERIVSTAAGSTPVPAGRRNQSRLPSRITQPDRSTRSTPSLTMATYSC